jgi:peptidoglycan hydrolase CwlO-like protein
MNNKSTQTIKTLGRVLFQLILANKVTFSIGTIAFVYVFGLHFKIYELEKNLISAEKNTTRLENELYDVSNTLDDLENRIDGIQNEIDDLSTDTESIDRELMYTKIWNDLD